MCLVALAIGQHPHFPVVIAANRDEYHDRPALPAAPWVEDAAVLGGRDLRAGGAWLAARLEGRFAVVTNFRKPHAAIGTRSRGDLVREFVLGSCAAAARIADIDRERHCYAPFNLVLGDLHAVWWLERESGRHGRFEPGTHAFSNGPIGQPWPKCRDAAAALQHALRAPNPAVDALMAVLADTTAAADADLPDTGVGIELERFLSPIHIVGDSYGTRASTVLALARDGVHWLLERRFGPGGRAQGESAWQVDRQGWSAAHWPVAL